MFVCIVKAVYYYFLILAFIFSLQKVHRKDPTLRVIPWLLGLGICTQLLEDILQMADMPHTIVFHIYNLLEFPIYVLYFYSLFHSFRVRRCLIAAVLVYIIFFILYFSFIRSITDEVFGSLSAVEGLLMSTFSLYFFYQLLVSDNYYHLPTYPHFYINSANIIYFSLQFVMSFDALIRQENPITANRLLYINMFTNVLMYVLYCLAFSSNIWIRKR